MAIEQLTTEKKEKTIVLSIVNHKGGVGKTTTVINLAHALVRLGESENKDYRVLVVDSDPQANATSVLFPRGQDITQMPTLADVYDEREPFPIIQVITPTSVPGLDLIPSSIGMFDVEPLVNSSQVLRKAMLDDALLEHTADGPNYDMVLIDTPPNLGVFMLNSLLVSNFYLVPIDCGSYFALEGMQTLESKIQQIKELHTALQLAGYLPIRLDNRTQVGHIALASLREFYGESVMETTIRINTDLEKAAFARQTIYQYKAAANGALDYSALAREIARKCGEGRK